MTNLPESVQLWLSALRSGEYTQTKGWLHTVTNDEHTYCCLGVACKLYDETVAPISKNGVEHKLGEKGYVIYGDEFKSLPKSVQTWLGLASNIGEFMTNSGYGTSLAAENDGGHSFTEIADLIEKYYDRLTSRKEDN